MAAARPRSRSHSNGNLGPHRVGMSIEDDLLPACTVRIAVRNEHSGSGFFVAPRLIATCAHVIQSPSDPKTHIQASELHVVGYKQERYDVEVKEFDAGADLALLRVMNASTHS